VLYWIDNPQCRTVAVENGSGRSCPGSELSKVMDVRVSGTSADKMPVIANGRNQANAARASPKPFPKNKLGPTVLN
jgi:hypothetical protein